MKRVFFTLITFVLGTASTSIFAKTPNVILFIADDVSWNDYGCYGNDGVRTPNIDALADGGIRLEVKRRASRMMRRISIDRVRAKVYKSPRISRLEIDRVR